MGYDGRDRNECSDTVAAPPTPPFDRKLQVSMLFSQATGESLGNLSLDKQQFIEAFYRELLDMFETMARKNTDYAGDSPWGNLGASVEIGIHPALGILIRMQDKFKRVQNITKSKTTSVKDESIRDTMQDLAVYAVLWRMADIYFG